MLFELQRKAQMHVTSRRRSQLLQAESSEKSVQSVSQLENMLVCAEAMRSPHEYKECLGDHPLNPTSVLLAAML